jgi:O-antigen/teichoic acid export membrane protein
VALQRAGADILIAVQVIFLIGIPLGIGPTMFFAYQESAWNAAFSLANGLISAIVVCGLALMGQSIVTTAIWYFVAGLLVTTAGTAVFLHRRRWNPLRVTLRLILPRVWSLLSLSLRFAAVQISGAFIYNAATLVTCATISVADAAEYNLVQKLYGFALGLYLSVYNPLWAGYTDAVHRGDWDWCQKTLKLTLVLTAAIFTGMAIAFTFFGNFFLQVLAGKGYVSQPSLFALLGLWVLFYILWSCVMAFLIAVERINIMMALMLICAIIFVPISGMLGQRFGIVGIAASSVLVFAPLAILGYIQSFWIVRRARPASSITQNSERV